MCSMCSELTPRARIPDTRIPQLMQPCLRNRRHSKRKYTLFFDTNGHTSGRVISAFCLFYLSTFFHKVSRLYQYSRNLILLCLWTPSRSLVWRSPFLKICLSLPGIPRPLSVPFLFRTSGNLTAKQDWLL